MITVICICFSSCASYTTIHTSPEGARVYKSGKEVGVTPYFHKDKKIAGSENHFRIEKEGFQPVDVSFSRNEKTNVGALVNGIFFMVPFLWYKNYLPEHHYLLIPDSIQMPVIPRAAPKKIFSTDLKFGMGMTGLGVAAGFNVNRWTLETSLNTLLFINRPAIAFKYGIISNSALKFRSGIELSYLTIKFLETPADNYTVLGMPLELVAGAYSMQMGPSIVLPVKGNQEKPFFINLFFFSFVKHLK
jgi:hypothetical protein